ncbi:MAG: phosphatidate cytidylyltransferase [Treponema sp.]|nr:phosphatidate cytidylyltransferase [Treponema sp.]MCL2238031.1 phosphatidate cytidylyltransferase [Treponema sp.]
MDRAITLFTSIFSNRSGVLAVGRDLSELKSEILRKSIHFLIALVPAIAAMNKAAAITLLLTGVLGYTLMEYLRLAGIRVPVISSIVSMASRPRDIGKFVMGPVTLGLGALLALLLYPSSAAVIAIYALAFGDGLASLVGKFFGKIRPAFLLGKSVEGSLACFAGVFASAFVVSGNLHIAFVAAFTAMVIEALPLEDYDNLAIPMAVGLAVMVTSAVM